jgi:hypothetical protein
MFFAMVSFLSRQQQPHSLYKTGNTDCFFLYKKFALLSQYYLTPILQAAYRTATLFSSKIGTERRKAGLSSCRCRVMRSRFAGLFEWIPRLRSE